MRSLLLLLLIPISVFVQGQQISGLAKDEGGTPVSGATVSLVRAVDSATIKLAVTKPNGSYDFSDVKEGNYKVMVTHVGYKPAFSTKFSLNTTDMTVPDIKISKVPANL